MSLSCFSCHEVSPPCLSLRSLALNSSRLAFRSLAFPFRSVRSFLFCCTRSALVFCAFSELSAIFASALSLRGNASPSSFNLLALVALRVAWVLSALAFLSLSALRSFNPALCSLINLRLSAANFLRRLTSACFSATRFASIPCCTCCVSRVATSCRLSVDLATILGAFA